MTGNQIDADELLKLGQTARDKVEESTDWRRVLIFRAISAPLLGLHTTAALMAVTRPELAEIGAVWLIVPGLACWTTATSAHMRSQRVVVGTGNERWWMSLLPFAIMAVLSLTTGTMLPIWAIALSGLACVALEVPRVMRADRQMRTTTAPGSRTSPVGPHREHRIATDWTLWFIALALGVLCTASATKWPSIWALPFALILPFFGWRGGRWPLPVFIGLAASITATYTAALLRGYLPGYSLVISIPLGVFATAAMTIPALIGHRR